MVHRLQQQYCHSNESYLMYNSLVIDVSYINKFFHEKGLIGRGIDFHHGSLSTLTQLVKRGGAEEELYLLQTFENLNHTSFDLKAAQIQKAMTENLTNYVNRIQFAAQRIINEQKRDLCILYELFDLETTLAEVDPISEEDGKIFLEIACKNFLMGGRYTHEFLDLAPQNIYLNSKNNKLYQKYVISNNGITYKGSQFHRDYIPSTDPYFKDREKTAYLNYAYAFQAGLVTFWALTHIDTQKFFFKDGQFDSYLMQDFLKLMKKDRKVPKEAKAKQEQELNDKKILKHLGLKPEKVRKFTNEFIKILQNLLSLDVSKRSIFNLLVSYPDNLLKVQNQYFLNCPINTQLYQGCGKLDEKLKVTPNECGIDTLEGGIRYYGNFENGTPAGIGCKELKPLKLYQVLGVENGSGAMYIEIDNFIHLAELNKDLKPDGDGVQITVYNRARNNKKKREQPVYFQGSFKDGQKMSGQEYYRGRNEFDGEFRLGEPHIGVMKYNANTVYDGSFENYHKKIGKLYIGERVFEGLFENDLAKKGTLVYPDGGAYEGDFIKGQRYGQGTYTYPNSKLKYVGQFKNNVRHGQGRFVNVETSDEVEIEYNNGKVVKQSQIPESIHQLLRKVDEKDKGGQEEKGDAQKKNEKQKLQDDDEEIPEDIQKDVEDDNDQPDLNDESEA